MVLQALRKYAAAHDALVLSGVGKAFEIAGDRIQAVHDVSLEVPPGSVLAIVGASGCGKSTLLRLIAGLDRADTGQISLGDAPIGEHRA